MHYTEVIAFLSLFVFMFLVILGFFGAFKCIVVVYQTVKNRLWYARKRQGISNLILQPVEQPIYQVNVDDSSLIAATQNIPLTRRKYITKKVEQKVLEEALIQRKNVMKSMNSMGKNGSSSSSTSTPSGRHSKSIIDYDLRYLTNITEMQRLVNNCWATNFGHRESLSEEERWIQKLVLKVNLKIDNHAAGYQTDPEMANALDQIEPPFDCPFSFVTGASTSSPLSQQHYRHYYNNNNSSSSTTDDNSAQNYTSSSSFQNSPPHYSRRSSFLVAMEMELPPPKFETLMIDHPEWPPSYEKCLDEKKEEESKGEKVGPGPGPEVVTVTE